MACVSNTSKTTEQSGRSVRESISPFFYLRYLFPFSFSFPNSFSFPTSFRTHGCLQQHETSLYVSPESQMLRSFLPIHESGVNVRLKIHILIQVLPFLIMCDFVSCFISWLPHLLRFLERKFSQEKGTKENEKRLNLHFAFTFFSSFFHPHPKRSWGNRIKKLASQLHSPMSTVMCLLSREMLLWCQDMPNQGLHICNVIHLKQRRQRHSLVEQKSFANFFISIRG